MPPTKQSQNIAPPREHTIDSVCRNIGNTVKISTSQKRRCITTTGSCNLSILKMKEEVKKWGPILFHAFIKDRELIKSSTPENERIVLWW